MNDELEQERTILDSLRTLPLFENLFLNMQAQNIALVDSYLERIEGDLLREYIERERTPLPTAMFVGAISQMWIFSVYELLRTWNQMVRELIEYDEQLKPFRRTPNSDEKMKSVGGPRKAMFKRLKISEKLEDTFYGEYFRTIESEEEFAPRLKKAFDHVQPAFRRIVDIRISLAKHEIPGAKGARAYAPGYGRIDMGTGSLYWMIEKKDGTSEIISRRGLGDELKAIEFET